jgi:sialidase-1
MWSYMGFRRIACAVFAVSLVMQVSGEQIVKEIHGASVQQKRAEIVWTKVLCKEPGRYIGWPTVCCRKNGELLAVFSGDRDEHVCPFGKVQMVRSKDQGETWTPAVNICNTQLDDRDAGIVELPNGDLVASWFTSLAYTSSIRDRAKLKPGSSRFYWWLHDEKIPEQVKKEELGYFTVRSTDGGKTWEPKVRSVGTAPHGPIVLKDGRLLYVGITYHKHFGIYSGERGEISVAESRDQGRSWQRIGAIGLPPGEKINMFHEPHAVETADGRIVAQIRYHGKGRGKDARLWQSESNDGGKAWSLAQSTDLAGFPPHLLRLRNGKLISVYGRRFDAFGNYACVSDDNGRTWDVPNEIKLAGHFNGDLGYPASAELPDGSILTVYYKAEKKGEKTCLMGTKWRMKKFVSALVR